MKNALLKSNVAKEYLISLPRLRKYLAEIDITHKNKYLTPNEYLALKKKLG